MGGIWVRSSHVAFTLWLNTGERAWLTGTSLLYLNHYFWHYVLSGRSFQSKNSIHVFIYESPLFFFFYWCSLNSFQFIYVLILRNPYNRKIHVWDQRKHLWPSKFKLPLQLFLVITLTNLYWCRNWIFIVSEYMGFVVIKYHILLLLLRLGTDLDDIIDINRYN